MTQFKIIMIIKKKTKICAKQNIIFILGKPDCDQNIKFLTY